MDEMNELPTRMDRDKEPPDMYREEKISRKSFFTALMVFWWLWGYDL